MFIVMPSYFPKWRIFAHYESIHHDRLKALSVWGGSDKEMHVEGERYMGYEVRAEDLKTFFEGLDQAHVEGR